MEFSGVLSLGLAACLLCMFVILWRFDEHIKRQDDSMIDLHAQVIKLATAFNNTQPEFSERVATIERRFNNLTKQGEKQLQLLQAICAALDAAHARRNGSSTYR
jgi:hypothetical protein